MTSLLYTFSAHTMQAPFELRNKNIKWIDASIVLTIDRPRLLLLWSFLHFWVSELTLSFQTLLSESSWTALVKIWTLYSSPSMASVCLWLSYDTKFLKRASKKMNRYPFIAKNFRYSKHLYRMVKADNTDRLITNTSNVQTNEFK